MLEVEAENVEHTLQLDARQRAMLQEMGVRLWQLPQAAAPEADRPVKTDVPPPAAVARAPMAAPAAAAQTKPQAAAPQAAPRQTAAAQAAQSQSLKTAPQAQRVPQRASVAQEAMMLSGQTLPAAWPQDAPPRWLFVLDAPADGAAASPLQGDAGKLLLNMAAAIRLQTEQGCCVYAPHCVPQPGQAMDVAGLLQSTAWLRCEIARVQPHMVIALGRHAACSLLGSAAPLGQLRGQPHRIAVPEGEDTQAALAHIPVVVSYPLAYLLRTPAAKRQTWQDLCLGHALLQAAPATA